MTRDSQVIVPGDVAAEMYATHGFPPELFEAMAAERNLMFDWDGFHEAMKQHGIESGGGQRMELFHAGPLSRSSRHSTKPSSSATNRSRSKGPR